jgi:hypothetical protein
MYELPGEMIVATCNKLNKAIRKTENKNTHVLATQFIPAKEVRAMGSYPYLAHTGYCPARTGRLGYGSGVVKKNGKPGCFYEPHYSLLLFVVWYFLSVITFRARFTGHNCAFTAGLINTDSPFADSSSYGWHRCRH